MTQEEKARAYDDALERARALNDGKDVDVEAGTTTCEYIFPVLKESKDEKIKEEITELVMQPNWKTEKEFHRRKELVAWLEKAENFQS